jgi:hypothetical protein
LLSRKLKLWKTCDIYAVVVRKKICNKEGENRRRMDKIAQSEVAQFLPFSAK